MRNFETLPALSLSNFKGSKYLECPVCGKMRFKPYAYHSGEIESPKLGRCQREVECGYHLKPKDYFEGKGEKFTNTRIIKEIKPLKTFELDADLCAKFSANYKNSTLYQFLLKLGIDYSETFSRYKVGAGRTGSTVFFQFDGEKYLTGKIIKYDGTGHRDKKDRIPVRWVHREIPDIFNDKEHVLCQCLFGQHLAREKNTICIVESEKTAIICAGIFKNVTWMATGGRTQMQKYKLDRLGRNKRKILFPDSDSVLEWTNKTREIEGVEIVNTCELNILNIKGADLADLLIDSGEEIQNKTIDFVNSIINNL